jgi:hypothetical protein
MKKRGGVWEWLWRGAAYEAAAAEVRAGESLLVQQVRELVEVADRLATRVESPTAGPGLGAALVLYREALSVASSTRRAEATAAFDSVAALLEASGLPASAKDTALSLLNRETVDVARLSEKAQTAEVRNARALLHGVLAHLDGPRRARSRALTQRFVRTSLLLLVLAGTALGGLAIYRDVTAPPDLLRGKQWRASSAYPGLNVKQRVCDGLKTRIFFHTNQEPEPFVEFDLGAPRQIRRLQIVNRRDCCDERAIPLVAAVSSDGKTFKELFRQPEPFRTLEKEFPPVTARYVRLTAKAMTWLHLERVSAF